MSPPLRIRKLHTPPCADLTEHACRVLVEDPQRVDWNLNTFLSEAEAGWDAEQAVYEKRLAEARAWRDYLESLPDVASAHPAALAGWTEAELREGYGR